MESGPVQADMLVPSPLFVTLFQAALCFKRVPLIFITVAHVLVPI